MKSFHSNSVEPGYEPPSTGDSLIGVMFKKAFAQRPQTVASQWKYWATLAVLACTLNIGILGLTPFRFGMWYQSEPIFFGLLVSSLLATLMVIVWWRSGMPIFAPLKQLPMQIFSVFLLWGLGVSLISEIPMRSFFGPPEIGEGWLYYASIWIHVLLACMLFSRPFFCRAVVYLLAFSLLLTTCLQSLAAEPEKIFKWADFLGFLGIFYFVALPFLLTHIPDKKIRVLLIIIGVFSVIVSDNYSSLGLMVIFAVLGWIAYKMQRHRFERAYMRTIITLGFLVPLLWCSLSWNNNSTLFFARTLIGMLNIYEDAFKPEGRTLRFIQTYQISLNPNNGGAFNNGSFGVRMMMNRVAYDFMSDTPSTFIVGDGFGSYNDILFRYAITDGVQLYSEKKYANWYIVNGHAFHPHHQWIYILTSTGIPSIILWMAFMFSLLRMQPRYAYSVIPAWLAYQCLSAVWFGMPIVGGFFAIAIAATLQGLRSEERPLLTRVPKPMLAIIPLLAIAFFAASMVQYSAAKQGQNLIERIQTSFPTNGLKPINDYGLGGLRQWWVAVLMGDYLTQKLETGAPFKDSDVAWLRANLFLMNQVSEQSRRKSVRIDAYRLGVANDVIQLYQPRDPIWNKTATDLMVTWEDIATKFALREPTRMDLLTPYFEYWITKYAVATTDAERESAIAPVRRLSENLLAHFPQNNILRWYYGKALMTNPQTEAQGFTFALGAYRDGVAQKIPLTNELRNLMDEKLHAPTR
jgi:hypothetical protein